MTLDDLAALYVDGRLPDPIEMTREQFRSLKVEADLWEARIDEGVNVTLFGARVRFTNPPKGKS